MVRALRQQNCRTLQPSRSEIRQRGIGAAERIGDRVGDDADLRNEAEELLAVPACQVGD